MLQNAASFLPAIGWSMPVSMRELQMRILKAYALCPDASESAERIAAQWLGGENISLVRATLDHLAGRGILVRRTSGGAELYGLKGDDPAGSARTPPADAPG